MADRLKLEARRRVLFVVGTCPLVMAPVTEGMCPPAGGAAAEAPLVGEAGSGVLTCCCCCLLRECMVTLLAPGLLTPTFLPPMLSRGTRGVVSRPLLWERMKASGLIGLP